MNSKFIEPLFNKNSLYIIGLGASATIAFFCWNKSLTLSDIRLKELNYIKNNILKAYKRSKTIEPLLVEQELTRNEQGINFLIKVVTGIAKKPQSEGKKLKNPFVKPFEKEIMIQKLGEEHFLLLNKFPVNDHHTIIVTKQFQPQEGPNSMLDLYQTYKVLSAVQGYGYFNSSPEAGSSQSHKHFQVLPHSALIKSDIIKIVHRVLKQEQEFNKLQKCYRLQIFKNIKHFIRPIEQIDEELFGNHIYEVYLNLLKDISDKKFLTNQSIVHIKYNLIMTSQFMMIIERKKEKYNDSIAINAVGFTGSMLVKNHLQLKELENIRIVIALEDVSVSFDLDQSKSAQQEWAWI